MFTGIIEGTGRVTALLSQPGGARLTVHTDVDLSACRIGDSIAIDGCCLTATELDGNRFSAVLSHETLARTTLGRFRPGTRVNLERALRVGDRLDGHMVQGHVDGVGRISRIEALGDSARWFFEVDPELLPYFVEKGSVAVDGISLTVNGVEPSGFHVAIIPHTAAVTSLGDKKSGDQVNVETDVIGKYIVALARRGGLLEGADGRLMRKLKEGGFA